MDAKPKQRKRAPHTRSRRGCQVCRIRRVRCDETRPSCIKCTSTGRKCEGYLATLVSSNQPILPRSMLISGSGEPKEERSLYYFRTQTVPQFSEPFGSEFWSRLVLQVGMRETCVRQAIVALGSLHEAFQQEYQNGMPRKQNNSNLSLREYACTHYSRALSMLNLYIRLQSWEGLDVALVCCVLCVAFEWLLGDYEAAHTHLKSGLLVLRQWSETQSSITRTGITFSSPTGHLIRGQIAPMLRRITLQAMTMSHDIPPFPWTAEVMLAGLQRNQNRTLERARDDLDIILGEVYLQPDSFINLDRHAISILSDFSQKKFSSMLSEWYSMYHVHLYDQKADAHLTDAPALDRITLTIWYAASIVMMVASRDVDEMLYDTLTTEFEDIVSLSEIRATIPVASTTSNNNYAAQFRLDMNTIPLLWLAASKCRQPSIRRRAIDVMRKSACREGMWDSLAQARICEEVIRIEEEGIESVTDETSVPACSRIRKMKDTTDLEKRRIEVQFWRQGSEGFGPMQVLTW